MYYNFDKQQVRNLLTTEQIIELLEEWGGLPEVRKDAIVCRTICHNEPHEGSHKLYYYNNTKLFQCYTNCGSFDIFELTQKVFKIQKNQDIDLNDAVRYISIRFGFEGTAEDRENQKEEDWEIFAKYAQLSQIEIKEYRAVLPEYDGKILSNFDHKIKIGPWLDEGITQQVLDYAGICYYHGHDQIVIPHYDINNRLIGIRGRTLSKDEAERYGKYRPILVNRQLYNHPLGFNLYGINWAKDNIKLIGKAIVFESEKSVLKYMSYFGIENTIAVACCGSNISMYQLQILKDAGAKEIIIAFDRQWEKKNSDEQRLWDKKLITLYNRLKLDILVCFIYDSEMLTGYKDSPIDKTKEIFLQLFKNRKYIKEK